MIGNAGLWQELRGAKLQAVASSPNHNDVTTQRLAYFLRASGERSLRQAAIALHLSQPALTAHIDALERALNLKLFERGRRGVSLTAAGRQLVPHAQRVLDKVDRLSEFATGLASGREGTLSIACYPVHVERFLGPVIGRFREERPNVELDLTQMRDDRRRESGRSLFDELMDSEVDLAMGPPHTHLGPLDGFEAYVARIVALVPDDHPHRALPTIPIGQLAAEPLLTAPSGYFSRLRLEAVARAAHVPLVIGAQSSSPPALMVLGKSGLGIPVLPDDYPLVGQHGIPYPTVTDHKGEEISTPVWLHWQVETKMTAPTAAFIEIARATAADELSQGRIRQDYYNVQIPRP